MEVNELYPLNLQTDMNRTLKLQDEVWIRDEGKTEATKLMWVVHSPGIMCKTGKDESLLAVWKPRFHLGREDVKKKYNKN